MSKSNPHGLVVGQELFIQPSENRFCNKKVTVTKVGQKWATIDGSIFGASRIDLQTLQLDGGRFSSPGKAWLSEEAYQQRIVTTELFKALRKKMNNLYFWKVPDGVTADDIRAAAKLLRIDIEGDR